MKWPTVMVKVSPPYKEALESAAQNAHMSISQYVRACVAKDMGYNLSADDALDGRGRPATYLNDSERKAARRRAERERSEYKRRLVEVVMKQERLDGIEALEEYLRAKGIAIDDEPVAQSA